MTEEHLDALPIGAMIQEYKILSILGTGGFGITYLGIDTHTDMKVAIKEYFPSFSATRRESTVLPKSSSDKDDYEWGLKSFLDEAKTVASGFPHHPNIVQVLRYIPANNTAYIIMRYEDGLPLDEILKDNTLTEKELLQNILLPLLDGLGKVHAAGFLHRDIKPGNIYMRRSDESPVLLDFGAARNAAAYGAAGREMTQIATEGYTPIEQSVSEEDNVAGWHQGAWSDIYALGVVAYRIIANELPPKSKVRSFTLLTKQKDPLKPAVEVGKGRFSETVLKAIDHALAFAPEDRPQSCDEWRQELTTQPAVEPPVIPEPDKKKPELAKKKEPNEKSGDGGKQKYPADEKGEGALHPAKKKPWKIVLIALIAITLLSVGAFAWRQNIKPHTYVVNGDGTVTDKTTGLMWKQCSEGLSGLSCDKGDAKKYNWSAALQHAKTVNSSGGFATYSDWRVPTIKELKSIVENDKKPSINITVFPSTTKNWYWSSSPYAANATEAWDVDLYYGFLNVRGKSLSGDVRLVRGGQ